MCRVLNKHHAGLPAGAVYIGRGSKWGNPFRIGPDGDRDTVIASHERWLAGQHALLRALDGLRGKDPRVLLRSASVPRRSPAAARQRDARGAHRMVAQDRVILVLPAGPSHRLPL
ncbi:conserved hypothetical protein [Mesorhizobium plurifarium]|uniref:DUF4326 domain-containing protein n=1 Tax=Mesorhizobium plurifarium TaxID=69974 RepID=A0A090E4K0_MESPL|nr:conserved hypothetical protein [Mesorhizobium plurifarium]